jgi:hypothetical protein
MQEKGITPSPNSQLWSAVVGHLRGRIWQMLWGSWTGLMEALTKVVALA